MNLFGRRQQAFEPANDLEIAIVRSFELEQRYPMLMALAASSLVLPQPPWWDGGDGGEAIVLPEIQDVDGRHVFAFTSYERMAGVYPEPDVRWALVPVSAILEVIPDGADLRLNPSEQLALTLGPAEFAQITTYLSWNELQPGPTSPDELDTAMVQAVRRHDEVAELVRAFATNEGELVRHVAILVAGGTASDALLDELEAAGGSVDRAEDVRLWVLPDDVDTMTGGQALLYGRSATLWKRS